MPAWRANSGMESTAAADGTSKAWLCAHAAPHAIAHNATPTHNAALPATRFIMIPGSMARAPCACPSLSRDTLCSRHPHACHENLTAGGGVRGGAGGMLAVQHRGPPRQAHQDGG